MSLMTFDEPRSRTWTLLVISPVISSAAGMFRYSSGTSSPISDDASLATTAHSIAASTSDTILRGQLFRIQYFGDCITRPCDVRPEPQQRAAQARRLCFRMHRAAAVAGYPDPDRVLSRRHGRMR